MFNNMTGLRLDDKSQRARSKGKKTVQCTHCAMGVHPFYHQEEGHSVDDHDGVVEHIDGEDEDVHHLDHRFNEIPSIPSGKEDDGENIPVLMSSSSSLSSTSSSTSLSMLSLSSTSWSSPPA